MNILKYVKDHCKKHNIKFVSVKDEEIQYPGTNMLAISGYFIVKDNAPTLGIALGCEYWKEVLIHEMCHSIQWLENDVNWTNGFLTSEELVKYNLGPYSEAFDAVDLWITKSIELDEITLNDLINRSIDVELDCEKRTAELAVKLIKNFDAEYYIQMANTYLRYYKYVEQNRVWHSYRNTDEITENQPTTFNFDYHSKLNDKELKLFDLVYKEEK